MAENLKDNLSSDYILAAQILRDRTVRTVLVYVEADEDVSFWRHVLHPYQTENLKFRITTPTRKGKHEAIGVGRSLLEWSVGSNLIVCVDSDYDYLLQGATEQSKKVVGNPYIFHTYAYSIENFLCYSNSLHPVVVQATKRDEELVDFNALMVEYSRIIYPLLLWSIYFYRAADTASFPIREFSECIRIGGTIDIDSNCRKNLMLVAQLVMNALNALNEKFPEGIKAMHQLGIDLSELGLTEDNAYLFVHGHTLKDGVVLPLLSKVCRELSNKKYSDIKNLEGNEEVRRQEHKAYKNITYSIDSVLHANTGYTNCILYSRIHHDVVAYINSLTP